MIKTYTNDSFAETTKLYLVYKQTIKVQFHTLLPLSIVYFLVYFEVIDLDVPLDMQSCQWWCTSWRAPRMWET